MLCIMSHLEDVAKLEGKALDHANSSHEPPNNFSPDFVLSGSGLGWRKDMFYVVKVWGFGEGPLARYFPTGIKNVAHSDLIAWRTDIVSS